MRAWQEIVDVGTGHVFARGIGRELAREIAGIATSIEQCLTWVGRKQC